MERLDRALSGGLVRQLTWLAVFTLAIFVLIGAVSLIFPEDVSVFGLSGRMCRLKGILYHFLDPGNMVQENGNRGYVQIFTFIIAVTGMAVFSGMLITTFSNIVDRRVSDVENGHVVYRSISDHYVIIGFGDVAINIVRGIYSDSRYQGKDGPRRTVILTSQDIRKVRNRLFSHLQHEYEQYICFYSGSIESSEHIASLNIDKAYEVYVLGENDEYGRDSKNLECVRAIARERGTGKDILKVHVQFDKLTSYSTIQKLSLPDEYLSSGTDRTIYFRPFNFYENWARILWGYNGYDDSEGSCNSSGLDKRSYDPLDFGRADGDRHVHLVIVGFNRMGRALFLEALRQCHYPNFVENPEDGQEQIRTMVTVLDRQMDDILPEFKAQYPYLGQISDICVEYVNAKVEDDDIREKLVSLTRDPKVMLTVAICLDDPDISLSTGLSLPDEVFYSIRDGKVENSDTRILIRQSMVHEGLGRILDSDKGKYSNVHIFGMTDKGVLPELMNDDMAMYVNAYYEIKYSAPAAGAAEGSRQAVLNSYFRYVAAAAESAEELSGRTFIDWVTDPLHHTFMHAVAQKLWLFLSESHRFSNRYQVDMYNTYDRYDGSPALGQMEHLRWNADRSIVGYRSLGNVSVIGNEYKDNKDRYKFHKDIIPYAALEKDESEKDTDVIENMRKLKSSLSVCRNNKCGKHLPHTRSQAL